MMTRKQVFVFLVFLLKHKVTYASLWQTPKYTKLNVTLQGFTFESSKVNTMVECYRLCEQNILCSTINLNLTDMTCERKYSTKTRHPEKTVRPVQNVVYMETRDDLGPPGSRPDRPIPSCKKLKEDDSQAKSGVYWMNFNEPSSAPFQVFCDMTTDGGGWTLVWSYTFTQYSPFNSWPNAVTPLPNWPVDKSSGTWVPESTATMLSETSRSAMDFTLWKKIGNEFLLKSNITNWIACSEGTGSLVNWVVGSLTCKVVKAMTPICTTIAPNYLYPTTICGPALLVNTKWMIHLEGQTDLCAPCHDPCGLGPEDSFRHLTNVPDPGNALYVR